MGTGVGGKAVGDINASPAAAVPFGMMQWGPDTSPDRASGGGYHHGDTALSGLSLTHLSGPGCPAYGDVPILPSVGPITGSSATATAAFRAGVAARGARSVFAWPSDSRRPASTSPSRPGPASPASRSRRRDRPTCCSRLPQSATGRRRRARADHRRPRDLRKRDIGQLLRHPRHLHVVLRRPVRPAVPELRDVAGRARSPSGTRSGRGNPLRRRAHVRHDTQSTS